MPTGVSEMSQPGLVVFGRVLKLCLRNPFTKLDGKIELQDLFIVSVGCSLTGIEGKGLAKVGGIRWVLGNQSKSFKE